MFTEEEKNEIITDCINSLINHSMIGCPVGLGFTKCHPQPDENPCKRIFPKLHSEDCPCWNMSEKYVKDKFWKAME